MKFCIKPEVYFNDNLKKKKKIMIITYDLRDSYSKNVGCDANFSWNLQYIFNDDFLAKVIIIYKREMFKIYFSHRR